MVTPRNLETNLATLFAVLAVGLLVVGLPRFTGPERYFFEPGEVHAAKRFWILSGKAAQVSLEPWQRITISENVDPPRLTCLSWQTEFGTQSAKATLRVIDTSWSARPVNRAWRTLPERRPCFRYNHQYDLTFQNSDQAQVIRFKFVSSQPYSAQPIYFQSGSTDNLCKECQDLPPFNAISDISTIKRNAVPYLIGSVFAGGLSTVLFIGMTTILGILYSAGRVLLPTAQARAVKREGRRASTGADFQADVTKGYDKPAPNSFRRRQDADDMSDIARDLDRETARMNALAEKIEGETRLRVEEKERLTREYEESVARVKAAHARYQREQGGT